MNLRGFSDDESSYYKYKIRLNAKKDRLFALSMINSL